MGLYHGVNAIRFEMILNKEPSHIQSLVYTILGKQYRVTTCEKALSQISVFLSQIHIYLCEFKTEC